MRCDKFALPGFGGRGTAMAASLRQREVAYVSYSGLREADPCDDRRRQDRGCERGKTSLAPWRSAGTLIAEWPT